MNAAPTLHASVVLAGARALLIRGPSGAGKSRLVLDLLQAAAAGRVHVEAVNGRLIARPPAALAGLLEVRGLGIRRLPHEPIAVVSWVVDLGAAAPPRLPDTAAAHADVAGVALRRLAIPPGCDPVPLVLAAVTGHP